MQPLFLSHLEMRYTFHSLIIDTCLPPTTLWCLLTHPLYCRAMQSQPKATPGRLNDLLTKKKMSLAQPGSQSAPLWLLCVIWVICSIYCSSYSSFLPIPFIPFLPIFVVVHWHHCGEPWQVPGAGAGWGRSNDRLGFWGGDSEYLGPLPRPGGSCNDNHDNHDNRPGNQAGSASSSRSCVWKMDVALLLPQNHI